MPPKDTIVTPKETLINWLAVLAILFIGVPLFILPVTVLLLLLFITPLIVYLVINSVKELAFPPRVLVLLLY